MRLNIPSLLFLLILPLLLSSCQTISFYTQAAKGQAEITLKRRPISKVLRDPTTEPKVASQLRLAQELVTFAEQKLSLDSSGSYQHYTDLKREHVVYIFHAVPEFSLEPKTWWYPIVGPQDYRGFFKKEQAVKIEQKFKEQGFDTYIGGVNAYSTLGFFRDPLLNTFIDYPEVDLAELIFHELTHHRYYEKGETAFNEALAEVVAREGTRRWLREKGDTAGLKTYKLRLKRRSAIRSAIEESIARLEELYSQEHHEEQMRSLKAKELSALKKRITQLYKGWQQKPSNFLSSPLNNAHLNAFTTYEALVPQLQQCLRDHNNDLDAFLSSVEREGTDILSTPQSPDRD